MRKKYTCVKVTFLILSQVSGIFFLKMNQIEKLYMYFYREMESSVSKYHTFISQNKSENR